MTMLRLLSRCLLVVVAMPRMDFVLAEDEIQNITKIDIDVHKNEIQDIPKIEIDKNEIQDIPKIEIDKDEIQDVPKIDVDKDEIQDIPKIDIDNVTEAVTPSPVKTRVVGGHLITNAKLGGYLIGLRYHDEFTCGGCLIHELIVLTAAHCLLGRTNPGQWIAIGGASTLFEVGERRQAKELVTPRSFSEVTLNMDVALILLRKPMMGKNIVKLTLCTSPLKPGTVLTVAGWGFTDQYQMGPHQRLRSVDVPILDKRACAAAYKESLSLTNSMICAGVLGRKDACTFDSGGPLVLGKKEVCGIVSFGIGCASVRHPGVYTDINFVKPFIKNAVQRLLLHPQ